MSKATVILSIFLVFALAAIGCHHPKPDVYVKPDDTFSVVGSVHEMNIYPEATPEFPEHQGKAEFISYCAICHSLRYVSTQPDFPAKTWQAEVDKMIHKYKAPIDSVTGAKIAAYLVAIKGKK
jgi:hypothetical protein